MKKTICDVMKFPNNCETVQFTACFVSMLMKAEGITEESKYIELYNLYNCVSGYSFLQKDLSSNQNLDSRWDITSQKLLREFDYYIGFTMDFAGYEFEEVQAPETKDSIFAKIKDSIDKDIPVIMQLIKEYQWVVVTGYDEKKLLYGLENSLDFFGDAPVESGDYEDELFILPDWYEKMAHAFILGNKKNTSVTIDDVHYRGIRIIESMQSKSIM